MTSTESQPNRPCKPRRTVASFEDQYRSVSIASFASLLEISESYVYKLLREDGLPHFKVGRSTRIPVKEASTWLQQRKRP